MNVYTELCKLDLTDVKNHKDTHLKYILAQQYIEDLNAPSRYKPQFSDERWVSKHLYMFITIVCTDTLTNEQAHDVVNWVYNILPVESHHKCISADYLHNEIDRLYI